MGVLYDIASWLWRLLPGNPILVRVVAMGSKRVGHLWARAAYLLALFVVLVLMGAGLVNPRQATSLAELAKSSTQIFLYVSLVQLGLMSFIAPIFCAGAITQEKDANTYHILLTTPLTSGQIVFGSLFSRMFFVWVLLLSGLPIFCIIMVYGGVTQAEVFASFGLAACTGLVTGSVAILIGFARRGTRRTIFAFFVGVVVYLLGVGLLGLSRYGALPEAPVGVAWNRQMSWLAPVHPFLSLFVVTGQTPAPDPAEVHHYGWPSRWLLAHPHYGYMLLTTLAALAMIVTAMIFVRAGAREGERSLLTRARDAFVAHTTGERRRRPRNVWRNPIAWREAATRASAGGRSVLRWLFIVGGVVVGFLLLVGHYSGWGPLDPGRPQVARAWLTALVWVELAVVLLVVTTTAATTLTREKESQTIELLLSTPLTSQYIVAGMLRGLVSFALPLIAVPTSTLALFVLAGLLAGSGKEPVVSPETFLLAPLLMIAYAAMAAMIGLYLSLVSRKTVQAVMVSTAVVLGAAGLLWGCGLAMLSAGPLVGAVVLPFAPFPAIQALVDYQGTFDPDGTMPRATLQSARFTRDFFSLVSAAIYLAVTYSVYRNMVRGFDMTVRRQTA